MGTPLKRVLVTGAAGYLGSQVVTQLRNCGFSVAASSRHASENLACDLLDEDQVRALIEAHKPEVVVHCAATVPRSGSCGYDDEVAAAESLTMVRNLVAARAQKIVHASSMTVYGSKHDQPVREDDASPASAYGRSKLAAETILLEATELQAAALRLPGLFGLPRRSGLVYAICEAAVRRQEPRLPEKPVMWAAMHVADAAAVIVSIVSRFPAKSAVMNVGYPGPFSISDLIQDVAARENILIPHDVRHPSFEMDLTRLSAAIGGAPMTFERRLNEMLEICRQQG